MKEEGSASASMDAALMSEKMDVAVEDAKVEETLHDDIDDETRDGEDEETHDEVDVDDDTPAEVEAVDVGDDVEDNIEEDEEDLEDDDVELEAAMEEEPVEEEDAEEEDEEEEDADPKEADSAAVEAEAVPEPEAAPVEEKPKPKKKFQAKAAPKCTLCGKSVYKTEEVLDSQDSIFHKTCLRCKTCKKSLVGREPVDDEDQVDLSTAQYREVDGELFCERHGQRTRGTLIQGTLSHDAQKNLVAERDEVQGRPSLQERNKVIKEDLKVIIGDTVPVCSRCGGSLDGPGEIVVSGMERFHKVCDPTTVPKDRTPRFFTKQAVDRPVITLAVGANKAMSFLFELDDSTKLSALRQGRLDPVMLTYQPDQRSRDGVQRTLRRGASAADAEEDILAMLQSSFTCTWKGDSDLSAVDPNGVEHPASVDTVYFGELRRRGKKVYGHLCATPEPVFSLYGSMDHLSAQRKPLVQVLLDGESDAVSLDPEDQHKFVVRGRRVRSEGRLSEKVEEIEVVSPTVAERLVWHHSLESVLDIMEKLDPDAVAGSTRVLYARLFKVKWGVLHQMVVPFTFDAETVTVTLEGAAPLFLTRYPEPTVEEEVKADPLANLKQTLKEKHDEEERLAALQDAPAAGGCCVIA